MLAGMKLGGTELVGLLIATSFAAGLTPLRARSVASGWGVALFLVLKS